MGDVLQHRATARIAKQRHTASCFLILSPCGGQADPRTRGFRTAQPPRPSKCGAPAGAHMPKEKYTKPPNPLPPMEQIQRVRFRFDDEDRQELMAMLPARLHEFGHRDDPVVGRSGAEMLIQTFEEAIGSYRTIELLTERFGAPNRADIVAAIRRLRQALAPFATAAMDPGTVDVLLGAFLGTFTTFDAPMAMTTLRRVDVMLADRE